MIRETDGTWSWLTLEWFYPSTFLNLSWEYPNMLYLLALIPAIYLIRWILSFRMRQKMAVAMQKKEVQWRWETLLRFIPDVFMTLAFAFIIIALARPQVNNEKVDQWSEGIDIMLVIDISTSMQLEDFQPNRLEAAKDVARNFISRRMHDRIGIVIFAGDAYSLSPLTTDYNLLYTYINEIVFNMIENQGTAIGSALAVATNRMRETESTSKVLILLSDGDNTAGNIDPITAARLAHSYDIKIYSIAIGKEGQVPFGKDFFGRPKYVENSLDETTLRKIADIGEGEFFRASDNEALEAVMRRIDTYEKAEIKETRFKNTTDYYRMYLSWAIVFFLIWLLTKSTYVSNILQD